MIGFKKLYYDNIPDEFTISLGTLDIKNHNKTEKTLRYKIGDKLIILPEWDGRNWITFKEMMELHEKGEVGEVIGLEEPCRILGGDGSRHYNKVVIKTPTTTFRCSPYYYLLGYKIIK